MNIHNHMDHNSHHKIVNKHSTSVYKYKSTSSHFFKNLFLTILAFIFICISYLIFILATIQLPDFTNFENRNVSNSTKIYDRTGKVVLYNVHDNIKRTGVDFDQISKHMKDATISIEDSHFYEHHGIRVQSIIRATLVNIFSGSYTQGASTITQQVVKNALLTREKTINRKVKEWVMAIKLDAQLPKDSILNIYLNESPYGGSIYGVEEASQSYFGKKAADLDIAESAYLAAIPQAPTYYSPFGPHMDKLEERKNVVLRRMYELNHINDAEYDAAKKEKVVFRTRDDSNGRALHFVFYIREYLENKYGKDAVENGGLKVITTLDNNLQTAAEDIVKRGAIANQVKFKANNAALIAIDPKTGQVLSMIGSRDYFDSTVDGNYNIAVDGLRQPGSTFKPFVYYLAFAKGLTPDTVLFDLPTEFSSNCNPDSTPKSGYTDKDCYNPVDYDGLWRGPISLRNALGQSLNIPAVKLQYIVGIYDTVNLVRSLGISTIVNSGDYGLSLALGGGMVHLIDITNAYGTFANNGVYNSSTGILEVRDNDNNLLEKYNPTPKKLLDENYVNMVNSVLSDNVAKTPAYGFNNKMNFGNRPVAAKTGTTNDYRDVWTIGYTPSLVVGMWAGNNNNTPIDKKVAGLVVTPIWREFMDAALKDKPIEYFNNYITNPNGEPYTKGIYCNSNLGTHSILYDLGKGNTDQAPLWQYPISVWAASSSCPSLVNTPYTNSLLPNNNNLPNNNYYNNLQYSSTSTNININYLNNNTNQTNIPTTTIH